MQQLHHQIATPAQLEQRKLLHLSLVHLQPPSPASLDLTLLLLPSGLQRYQLELSIIVLSVVIALILQAFVCAHPPLSFSASCSQFLVLLDPIEAFEASSVAFWHPLLPSQGYLIDQIGPDLPVCQPLASLCALFQAILEPIWLHEFSWLLQMKRRS